jgi:hypothetical protein
VSAVAVASALAGAPAASAHGTCATTFTPPSWDGNISNRNWSWTGRVDCTESHWDIGQRSCLQSSPTGGMVIGWTTEWCSADHEWAGPGKSFVWAYNPSADIPCRTGYTYRVWGVGWAGNGGDHWGMDGASATTVPCPIVVR